MQFDIYQNSYDPPVPYISFMENGNPEVHLAESGTLPFELYGETPVHAWISYDAASTRAFGLRRALRRRASRPSLCSPTK